MSASLVDAARKLVLFLLQLVWGVKNQVTIVRSSFLWWIKVHFLGWRPQALRKRPKAPAMIGSGLDDLVRFASWCCDNEVETIGLYDPSGRATIGAITNELTNIGAVENVVLEPGKESAIVSRGSRRISLRVLHGRNEYLSALIDNRIDSTTPTTDLPGKLDTVKYDILVLCGTEELGDFPPLALRACELYFTTTPMQYPEYCRILNTFARSEQRLGT